MTNEEAFFEEITLTGKDVPDQVFDFNGICK